MNVKPIPAATTYAISSTNGATDGGARREYKEKEKDKKPTAPDSASADKNAATAESEDLATSSLSQMVDSEKVLALLNSRPTAKNTGRFVKSMAPAPSQKTLIDVKKFDKSV